MNFNSNDPNLSPAMKAAIAASFAADKARTTRDAVLEGVDGNRGKRRRLNAPPGNGGNKYGAVRTTVDGISFASKAEAEHYSHLCLLMKAGEVAWFCRQPRFVLEGGVEYVADFIVCWNTGGGQARVEVVDCKGMALDTYIIKKKQMKARYGIDVVEVRK